MKQLWRTAFSFGFLLIAWVNVGGKASAQAADSIPNLPVLEEREEISTVGILLVTGDRGLAGPFNSQIVRANGGFA